MIRALISTALGLTIACTAWAATNPFIGQWTFNGCGKELQGPFVDMRPDTFVRRILEFRPSVIGDPTQGIMYSSYQLFGDDRCSYKFAAPLVLKGAYNILDGQFIKFAIFHPNKGYEVEEIYKYELLQNGQIRMTGAQVYHPGDKPYAWGPWRTMVPNTSPSISK